MITLDNQAFVLFAATFNNVGPSSKHFARDFRKVDFTLYAVLMEKKVQKYSSLSVIDRNLIYPNLSSSLRITIFSFYLTFLAHVA